MLSEHALPDGEQCRPQLGQHVRLVLLRVLAERIECVVVAYRDRSLGNDWAGIKVGSYEVHGRSCYLDPMFPSLTLCIQAGKRW